MRVLSTGARRPCGPRSVAGEECCDGCDAFDADTDLHADFQLSLILCEAAKLVARLRELNLVTAAVRSSATTVCTASFAFVAVMFSDGGADRHVAGCGRAH